MISSFLALGTIALQILIVTACVYLFVDRAQLSKIAPYTHIILRIIFTGAVMGSLYFSEVLGYTPCLLCWWQRIFIFGIALLVWTADVRKSPLLQKQLVLFSIIGGGFALFHNIIDIFPTGIDTCGANGISCLKRYIDLFGYITIPMMSLTILVGAIVLVAIVRLYPQQTTTTLQK